MGDRIDLHIHSYFSSDGDTPPAEILRMADEMEMAAIAIADHDTTAAYPRALQLGEETGLEVIPNLELTTLFDDREFHLLLPFVDWEAKVLKQMLIRVTEGRFQEARERVARLQALGFDIAWKDVREASDPFPPLGVTIAQVVLEKAVNRDHPAYRKYFEESNLAEAPYIFYKDYFAENRPAFVPRRNIGLLEVLEVAGDTGGVPVLAHPGAAFQQVDDEDLRVLKERGLAGLEVYTSYHDPEQTRYYADLAARYELVPTTGSDYHGSIKPFIPFGCITEGGYWMVEALQERRGT